jgi:hypothetical protein
MTNPPSPHRYELFLVRLWAEGEPARWRASARNIHTGEETHFATPERLFVHLQAQMDEKEMGRSHWHDSERRNE